MVIVLRAVLKNILTYQHALSCREASIRVILIRCSYFSVCVVEPQDILQIFLIFFQVTYSMYKQVFITIQKTNLIFNFSLYSIQHAYLKVWLDNFTTLERLAKYEAVCIGWCQCPVLIDPSLMECLCTKATQKSNVGKIFSKAGEAISKTTGTNHGLVSTHLQVTCWIKILQWKFKFWFLIFFFFF